MIVRAKNNLSLSRAQAAALARLIQAQLYAYDEAIGEERTRRNASQPFTGSDLDLIEPLLALLKEEAQQEKA